VRVQHPARVSDSGWFDLTSTTGAHSILADAIGGMSPTSAGAAGAPLVQRDRHGVGHAVTSPERPRHKHASIMFPHTEAGRRTLPKLKNESLTRAMAMRWHR
jgi:hypothetical protein